MTLDFALALLLITAGACAVAGLLFVVCLVVVGRDTGQTDTSDQVVIHID